MNVALAVLAAVAAVNPFRVGAVLGVRDRPVIAAFGGLIALGSMLLVAVLSASVLDALDITTPTARIAAGISVALVGARAVLREPPRPEPALPGRRAALVPVAFPVLIDPGITLLTVAVADDRGVVLAVAVAAVALTTALMIGLLVTAAPTWLPAAHTLVGAIAVAAGVAVTVAGVFDL